MKNLPSKIIPGPDDFTSDICQTYVDENRTRKVDILQNSHFMRLQLLSYQNLTTTV